VIEELLPADVVCAEALEDPPDATLFPEEEPEVARAVEKRRREFVTGRWCARRALAKLGHPPVALPRGPKGEPRWPDGVVGAITHCEGYRAAAVAHRSLVRAVGVDAEPHAPLPDGVLDAISLPEERAWVARLAAERPDVQWDRLLFSAKESVYKAWFPLARRWLGFEEASLHVDATGRAFHARLLVPGPVVDGREITGFTGGWLVAGGLVLTAIAVPAGGWQRRQADPPIRATQ
jgi:enterobactin synthetase component D / holo-[acyl-carrier protein] synthase